MHMPEWDWLQGRVGYSRKDLWSSPEDLRVALDQLLLGVQHHLWSWRESKEMWKTVFYSLLAHWQLHCQCLNYLMDLEREYDEVVTEHTPPESLLLSECQAPHVCLMDWCCTQSSCKRIFPLKFRWDYVNHKGWVQNWVHWPSIPAAAAPAAGGSPEVATYRWMGLCVICELNCSCSNPPFLSLPYEV